MRRVGIIGAVAAGLAAGLLTLSALQVARVAFAAPLVADISDHLVAITTGFAGTDVLLFGAVEEKGDVVVMVRGPREAITMYRKSRVAGIWINTASMTFEQVPSFYAIAASAPLEDIAGESLRRRHELGVEYALPSLPLAKASRNIAREWKAALLRNLQRQALYPRQVGRVNFLGNQLFRTRLFFPANVPTGNYQVETYFIRDQRVIGAQTTPLAVSKLGMEADIFDFAHHYAPYYGLIAVAVALVAGWIAHAVFRRG